MKRTIHVCLGDAAQQVGTLHDEVVGSRERSVFAYESAWLGDAERFALEPGLPLVAGSQLHRKAREGSVFHSAFAETEPDEGAGIQRFDSGILYPCQTRSHLKNAP